MNDPGLVTAAYKTVETFSGIVKKQLWLKDGSVPRNDGNEIVVPFKDRSFYLLVERQLAHILFRSDARAREKFVVDSIGAIEKLSDKYGLQQHDRANVQTVIERIIDILESRRIESLWGMLYPGSYARSRERLQMDASRILDRAHANLFDMMVCLDAELEIPPGPLDRFRPLFLTALKKVERRGFTASLALARWLVSKLVNEILKRDRKGYRAAPDEEGSQVPSDDPGKDDAAEQGEPRRDQEPKVTARQRIMALQAMAHEFGQLDQTLEQHYNDYRQGREDTSFYAQSRSAAATALSLDLRDEAKLEQVLQDSENHMQAFLDDIQKQLVQPLDHDAWLKKDTMCRLTFVNVAPGDFDAEPVSFTTLSEADSMHIERLRSKFFRVIGRRATRLEEVGTELDVGAYLEARTTGLQIPYFKQEARGRGFRTLLLIDRSHSMRGARIGQAERAARMLMDALDFPFVELAVWGFQSPDDGEVTITRFSPLLETFHTTKSPVDGDTPLHIGLKVAIRELTEGSEVKQLFVLTDGAPMFWSLNHRPISEKALRLFVREQVQYARRQGINVTALLIGDRMPNGKIRFDVKPEHLQFMFGSERYWKCVDERRLGEDLVHAVTDSFLAYLTN
jgi:hypothetical protein